MAGAISVMTLSGGLLAQHAFASTANQPQSLASEIAAKFGLKQADVQAVVDQHKQEDQTYHQQMMTDRINQAVTDGKLTSAQRDLILAKIPQVQSQLTTIRAMTDPTARKAAMQQLFTDTKAWATANNIDLSWVGPLGGHGGRGHGGPDGVTPSSASGSTAMPLPDQVD